MSGGQTVFMVKRTDGKSESFLLDPSETLDQVRAFLTAKNFMTADDAFLFQGTSAIDPDQEASISLDKVVKDGVLAIGEPTDTSPISDDGTARYSQLRNDQKNAIFKNVQIWRGLTFTANGFGQTFQDVYTWAGGYMPLANTPRVNTELTSHYSFSK